MTGRFALAAMLLFPGAAVAAPVGQSIGAQIADATDVGPRVQAVGADSLSVVKVDFAAGVTGYPDLTYQTLPGYRPLKLDLFLPPKSFAAAGPRPLIVYIHGGGWMAGGPRRSAAYSDWPKVLAMLAARGYVVASVSYRFSREAPFPAAIQDVKAGIRWLRARAATYNIDPKRAAIWGQSAGGHLAALAGVSCNVASLEPGARIVPGTANVETVPSTVAGSDTASDCVQAVVGWFGIYDFATMPKRSSPPPGMPPGPSAEDLFLGCPAGDCTAQQRAFASPVTYIDRTDPPFLLMHGSDDHTVPEAQTETFDAALRAADVPVRKIVIPGADHSWIGTTPAATSDASKRALREAIDFIDAQIGDGRRKN
ncbi:alpha/beta hydrolase [Sphingomonas sp. RT2P30]|uniref:alpha/beta hydrolase n=1 Tax=Parasphingomonas halimpatiens TaxID=3096162 RepID=UPI002FCBFD81